MTYQSIVQMASSQSLKARIVAAAADAGVAGPQQWVEARIWHIVSEDGWAEAWDYATSTWTVNVNPDTGMRNDVIGDPLIKTAVEGVALEEASGTP